MDNLNPLQLSEVIIASTTNVSRAVPDSASLKRNADNFKATLESDLDYDLEPRAMFEKEARKAAMHSAS